MPVVRGGVFEVVTSKIVWWFADYILRCGIGRLPFSFYCGNHLHLPHNCPHHLVTSQAHNFFLSFFFHNTSYLSDDKAHNEEVVN